jgi:hypothetical protein
MPRAALAFALLVALAAPALAEVKRLSAAEARRTFIGLDMQGVHQPSGERWRECVDRNGRTTYWFGGSVLEGRLSIRNDGALCFAYGADQNPNSNCWHASPQSGGNYRFDAVDGSTGAFVTTATRRVNICQGPETPVS